jgi:GAF domain-containing protein
MKQPGMGNRAVGPTALEDAMVWPSAATGSSPAPGPLATALVALAGTPDHSLLVGTLLLRIAHLTVARIAAATHASVTALRGRAYTTVAFSDELIREIDAIQYAENAGPCVEAIDTAVPVGVPDIDATVRWPGFREAAPRMGLHASVSVPLYAGRGEAVAALNVYGHDRAAMAPLIAGVRVVHDDPGAAAVDAGRLADLDAGGREFVGGYAEALTVRATIRLAIELIRSQFRCGADDAYRTLCVRAGEAGTDLGAAAAALVDDAI